MAQAIGDPEELARFAGELSAYAEMLQAETGRLQGCFAVLGASWSDEKRAQFEDQFNELVSRIGQFKETCNDCVPYLSTLAERLRDYLQS